MCEKLRRSDDSIREPSPDIFLRVLSIATGMKRLSEFKNGASDRRPTKKARKGGVVGVVIIGSVTNPHSRPKDIDILTIVKDMPNSVTRNYSEALEARFDKVLSQEKGRSARFRLDDCECMVLDTERRSGPRLYSLLTQQIPAILESPGEPLVFSFDQESADQITQAINFIFASGDELI